MRHRVSGYKLGRTTSHRKAMWRNMAISLFTHGQITTTLPKAKSLKPFVEKLITVAKSGDLASRRRVIKALTDKVMVKNDSDEDVVRNRYGEVVKGPKVVKKLFSEIAPAYSDRNGGYTRIIKLAKHRIGDGSDLCVLQLISKDDTGPQVAGQYSRRREKANKRMERAAALRKAKAAVTDTQPGGAAAEADESSDDMAASSSKETEPIVDQADEAEEQAKE